jgi:omega-6 fatty acid desaturase (delta-12 desaturase)
MIRTRFMAATTLTPGIAADPHRLKRALRDYRGPRPARSVVEVAITILPFVGLWALTWAGLQAGYAIALVLVIPAAAFLVRLFMIQHDCGHHSFFRSRRANDWVGRIIGLLTMTPYAFWRYTHARHHASHGKLDGPRLGGINTLTVDEYRALPPGRRFRYRLYRHPLILFGLGPAWIFLVDNRLPMGFMKAGWMPWISTMGTNLAIAAGVAVMVTLVGAGPFVLIHLPIVLLAASVGVWLFYVQHQFEHTYWAHDEDWRFHEASLHGSSYYDLPAPLRWVTANIGVHHVHHLCSGIPGYRLPEVLRDYPELRQVSRLTLLESLRLIRLGLWDEDKQRLVSFREARAEAPT